MNCDSNFPDYAFRQRAPSNLQFRVGAFPLAADAVRSFMHNFVFISITLGSHYDEVHTSGVFDPPRSTVCIWRPTVYTTNKVVGLKIAHRSQIHRVKIHRRLCSHSKNMTWGTRHSLLYMPSTLFCDYHCKS